MVISLCFDFVLAFDAALQESLCTNRFLRYCTNVTVEEQLFSQQLLQNTLQNQHLPGSVHGLGLCMTPGPVYACERNAVVGI